MIGRSISLGSNIPLRPGSALTPGLRYKNLGKSGLRISNVGLGTWPIFSSGITEEIAESIIKLAFESGINIFDISESHSGTNFKFKVYLCLFHNLNVHTVLCKNISVHLENYFFFYIFL